MMFEPRFTRLLWAVARPAVLRLVLRPPTPVVFPALGPPPAADASLCSADLAPFQCPRPSATLLS